MFSRQAQLGLILGFSLTGAAGATPASAAEAAVYDGFRYSANRPLLGLSGGNGWAGPWGQHGPGNYTQIVAGSLSFGDLQTSGGAALTTSDAPVGNPRPLDQEYGASGTTLYFSLLVQPLSPVNGKYFGFGVGNLHVGKGTGHLNYGIERGGGGDFVGTRAEPVQGKTNLLVVRVTFAQGNDRVELWVDPTPGRPLPEPHAKKEDVDLGRSSSGGFGADLRCVFDEWRMGSTFEEVCPVKSRTDQAVAANVPPPDTPRPKSPAAKKLDADLAQAAGAGDLTRVRELLSKGADPNGRDAEDSFTPLTAAIEKGRLPVIEELLARGAKLTVADGLGTTPLQTAVEQESPAALEALLARGGDVQERSVTGSTLLIRAALFKKPAVVKVLLAKGAKANDATDDGTTALMLACDGSALSVELSRLLLAAGADPNVRDKAGRTALTFARNHRKEPAGPQLLELLEKAGARLPGRYLLVATQEGDLEGVRTSLERGEDPNQVDPDGGAPLDYAIIHPVEIATALLDKGARLDAPAGKGAERLALVAEYGKPEMLSLLLSRGGALNTTDGEGRSLLMIAARGGQVGNLKVLLAKKLDPNGRDRLGGTAAFYALGYWTQDFAEGKVALQLLLSKGADPNAAARGGATMLGLATAAESEEAIRFLLGYGANPNKFGPEEVNPLTYAATEGNADLVRLLLSKGAKANPTSRSGLTPLRAALEGGHRSIVRMLQSAGARQ